MSFEMLFSANVTSLQVPPWNQKSLLYSSVDVSIFFKTVATKETKLPKKYEKMVKYLSFDVTGAKLNCG